MKKLGLLASLYIAQLLPVAFFGQTLPVFLREEGMSLETIGLLSLLSLPWTVKVVWAPLVDRYGRTRWGHYKSWILAMQGFAALAIFCCAFLELETHFQMLLLGMGVAITAAATQDIATDALAVNILTPEARGLGNGIQNAGGYIGGILGGGVLLILLDRWGWRNSLLILGAAMLLLLIPIAFYQEPVVVDESTQTSRAKIRWGDFLQFFQQPGTQLWIVILLFYTMGVTITNIMFRPFLVDLGLSLSEIGVLYGIVAYSAGLVGSITSGLLVRPLGRKRSLVIFGLMMVVATALHILPTVGITNTFMLYSAAIGLQLAYSMAYTPLSTMMMDRSRAASAGFDYTLQVTLVFVGSILVGSLSGFIVAALGYGGTFAVSVTIGLVTVVLIQTFEEMPET